MIQPSILPPFIYKVVEVPNSNGKEFTLRSHSDKFVLPPKIYGNLKTLAYRVWNTFYTETGSIGALLSGHSGTGKTLTTEIICNIALANGLPVIVVSEIKATVELVNFLSGLDNCVIQLDEYGKTFNNYSVQDIMLPMFSSSSNRRLYLLTENDINTINNYILNRPGRIRYHLDFSKTDIDGVMEYMEDHNVSPKFKKELLSYYNKALIFSYDHLKALVKEHIHYPNDDIEFMLSILNMKLFVKEKVYTIVGMKSIKGELEYTPLSPKTIDVKGLETGRQYNIRYVKKQENNTDDTGGRNHGNVENMLLGKDNIESVTEDTVIMKRNGILVELSLTEPNNDMEDSDNYNNRISLYV